VAGGEVQRAIDIFHYYAEKARDLGGVVKSPGGPDTNLSTKREPLGTVGLITPWNYPIAIPAWKLAPGTRERQHAGTEAGVGGAELGADSLRVLGGGGSAGRPRVPTSDRLIIYSS